MEIDYFDSAKLYQFLSSMTKKVRRSIYIYDENEENRHPKQPEYREFIDNKLNGKEISELFFDNRILTTPPRKQTLLEMYQASHEAYKLISLDLRNEEKLLRDALLEKDALALEVQNLSDTKLTYFLELRITRRKFNELENTAELFYLTKKQKLYDAEIERLQARISELERQLAQEYEGINLLAKKDKKIEKLKQRLNNKSKKIARIHQYYQNQKQKLSQKLLNQIQRLAGKVTYYEEQDNNLRSTILELQTQIKNHRCPPSVINQVNCSHSDYQQIKQDKDNYYQQLIEKERIIAQQKQRITELENPPPVVLSEEIKQSNIRSLKEILNIPLPTATESLINTSANYGTIVQIREKLIKEKLKTGQQEIQSLSEQKKTLQN
ncbi:15185_t:CDS:2 [Funneliformis geosporum]|uniref:15185_t:CDS:1 n=1 Tax=Funneliformis geosporum TaxID=1117311 RepID=A0A9W4SUJ6_9GLOM|nr:15185_t:CDS:2 [Funneliformis geosporum]